MKINDTALNKIRLTALAVVESYGVKCRKSGNGYLAKCPFHEDSNPSFQMAEDGHWKCHACDKKGRDIFSFVAEKENLDIVRDFPEIVKRTASKCGLGYLLDCTESQVTRECPTPSKPQPAQQTEPLDPNVLMAFGSAGEAMAKEVEQTNLYSYLCQLWHKEDVKRVMDAYKVGRGHFMNPPNSKYNNTDSWCMNPNPCKLQNCTESSAFPSIDANGNVVAIKLIPYPKEDHHRIKGVTDGASLYWFKPNSHVGAYFGTHLLASDTSKPIAIVESEKSAIIGTLFMPSYIWIATAGATNLSPDRMEADALRGRELHIFPDTDHMAEWSAVADRLRESGFKVKYRDEVMKQFPPASKLDIADIIVWDMERAKQQHNS